MAAAAPGHDEELRLRTLYAYRILDTMEERAFDELCEIAASICDTPTALITLLDRRRQWFKARLGFSPQETERECSFCAHAILQGDLMVVHDAVKDARFMHNRLVVAGPHIRFYAGAPLRASNGQPLGTLCVIDQQPRQLSEWQRNALKALARQVEAQLELHRAQHDKDLLGRFLIHDMRNPLTSMLMGLNLAIQDAEKNGSDVANLHDVREATSQLNRRVNDFHSLLASEHGSLPVRVEPVNLEDVVAELQRSTRHVLAERNVCLEARLEQKFTLADPDLIRRILENLVYNAAPVAPPHTPITIASGTEEQSCILRVSDQGPGVPEQYRKTMFQAYQSYPVDARASTGLGLAFCDLAARAMGGRIEYDPTESRGGAAFRLTLPHAK